MLKRILLVEPEFEQEESITMMLEKIFPGVHIVNFSVAGDLLKCYEEIKVGDIIVTERNLPLLYLTQDAGINAHELQLLFSGICDEWKINIGGEIILAHLRRKGITCPAVIYTSSDFDGSLSSEGYVCDSQTVYCEKEESFDNLILAIRTIASTLIQVRTHPCL